RLFNAQQQIKHLEDWSEQQDRNLEKQAEQHEADLTDINNATSAQLGKMRLETASVKTLYTQVQEDQQRQGKELMELTQKLENARGVLRKWGLNVEQIEGLLSGILDPSQVESIVVQELASHLKPLESTEPQPESLPTSSTADAIQPQPT